MGQDGCMPKAGCYLCAAVDACEYLIFFVAAQLQCFFNNRREIFLLINMNRAWEGNHLCCKYPVGIAFFRRHQAVCSVEDRGRQVIKLLLLVLPCSSKIALQVRKFL